MEYIYISHPWKFSDGYYMQLNGEVYIVVLFMLAYITAPLVSIPG